MSELKKYTQEDFETWNTWLFKRRVDVGRGLGTMALITEITKTWGELGFEPVGSNLHIQLTKGKKTPRPFQTTGKFTFKHKTENVAVQVEAESYVSEKIGASAFNLIAETEELRAKYMPQLLKYGRRYVTPRWVEPPPKKTYAHLLVQTEMGYHLIDFEVGARYAKDIYYNEKEKYQISELEKLIMTTKYGLIYLSGVPGSGKTSLIYDLTKRCKGRKFVFIPHSQLGIFQESRNLLELFDVLKGAVLIIEDAEGLFKKRDENTVGGVTSFLLNATDGFLAEALGCLTIVTQNMTENIDSAFLRAGRLVKHCNFGKLTFEQTKAAAEDLQRVMPTEEKEYALAEVYGFPLKEGAVVDPAPNIIPPEETSSAISQTLKNLAELVRQEEAGELEKEEHEEEEEEA